jgi:class 3 adenylate cyclase/tetratricopeptide (TPR) repeat protein
MMCPQCHAEHRGGLRFCEDCGCRLTLTCSQCGGALASGKRFCGSCGTPAGGQSTASTPSPESYTPKHLAERILTSKSALEGERKQVTVLFADLKGSMELLADRDPEEARKLLDPVLERMMDAVHRYEGTVNQVMGDGIMALFGAPIAHEDHAVRACYAALDMQIAIRRYAEEVRRTHGIEPQIRVGVNSGEVVVRAIGGDLRMDYTAVGQTTHLAARMEQLAPPGSIRLTADALRLAEGYITVKPLGPVPVKGLETPIEVYDMTGAGPIRSRMHAAAARGLTRLVGRDADLEQLRQALGRAAAGSGQVVALVGEPGVGKSRLVWEVTHSHRTHGWLIVEAGSSSYGKATPYLPVIDLLKGYFEIDDRDEPRKMQEKVTGKILTLDRALEPTLPALLSLLEVPVEEPPGWRELDPSQRRQRTLDALKWLLLREAQDQPVLVVFEDLHWIDGETQALLDGVVESLPAARLMLLVNYRPEYEHRWGGKTYYTQLRLDPLPPESAGELLQALLGSHPSLEPLTRLLIERTEGNPFFLEESVRTLVETGALIGTPGAYRLGGPTVAIQVPATVQAVLAARIDRLPPEEKRLLQSAAVIGKDVPDALLQAVGEMGQEDLRRGLAHLQAAEFLYETSIFPELVYTFKHALTQEVAYGSLLHDRRRALHARVLSAMEHTGHGQPSLHAERLAHHALKGEEWARAARYLHLAGRRAIVETRYASSVGFYEAAIRALDQQGDDADLTLKLDAYLELGTARAESSQLEGYKELMDRAEALARALNDRERLAQVRVRQAQALWNLWSGPRNLEDAAEVAREAFALAAPDDLRTRSYAQFLAGVALLARGRFHDAVQEFDAGVALFTAVPVDAEAAGLVLPIRGSIRAWEAEAYAALGEFGPALAAAAEAQRIASELRHTSTEGRAGVYSGHVHLMRGDIEAAARAFERGLASGRGVGVNSLGLATSHLLLGRRVDGMRTLARAFEFLGDPLGPQSKINTRYGIFAAEAYLAAGLLEKAAAEAARGLALATVDDARAYHVPLGRIRAEALALQGKEPCRDEALSDWSRLIDLATELSMRPELAHCHFGLSKLYRRTGDDAEGQEHLTTAVTMYREMDMGFWLTQAEAALEPPHGNSP